MNPETIAAIVSPIVGLLIAILAYRQSKLTERRQRDLDWSKVSVEAARHSDEATHKLIDQLQEELVRVRKSLRERDNDIAAMRTQMDHVAAENDRLRRKIEEMQKKIAELHSRVDRASLARVIELEAALVAHGVPVPSPGTIGRDEDGTTRGT